MKVGSNLEYEVPDECPEWCKKINQNEMSQDSLCTRCPVFNCRTFAVPEEDRNFAGDSMQLIKNEDFSDDFAKMFVEYFKKGEIENV